MNAPIKLLVSVRNVAEAQIALAAGADLLDVKEPRHGSLGSAHPRTLREIAEFAAGHIPLSAALGELSDLAPRATNSLLESLPREYHFGKLGLRDMASIANWSELFRDALTRLPASVAPVAVVYADWRPANAPPPYEVLEAAISLNCRAVLVDTHDKHTGGLFEHWSSVEVARFVNAVRRAGLLCVLAGSLTVNSLPLAIECAPHIVAVRGAACEQGREGNISLARIRDLQNRIAFAAPGDQHPAPEVDLSKAFASNPL